MPQPGHTGVGTGGRRTSSVSLDLAKLQANQRRASLKSLMGKMETKLQVLRALCSAGSEGGKPPARAGGED
jgi:hypothetical protein